jgi:V/A-type H+/Na+-transporting ATPase subunit K
VISGSYSLHILTNIKSLSIILKLQASMALYEHIFQHAKTPFVVIKLFRENIMPRIFTITSLLIVLTLLSFASAQSTTTAGRSVGDGLYAMGQGLIALGAGLAIGIGALAVGRAQAAIGSAGAGTLAERPQAFGQILIYLVIPETLIIFAFVIAFFLYGKMA